jgi:gamma-glutamyltranspeptidase/glutathione hydrolase
VLEHASEATPPYHSAEHVHLLAETMRRAYADRAEFMGDPDFVDVPVAQLTSDAYAAVRAATIADTATPSAAISHGDPRSIRMESPETTHYSVVDSAGNCVSVTVTLNSSFGAKLAVGGAGFLLNNEMDDFSARPGVPNLYGLVGGEANAIVPGKRMLSSMTPTIVLRDDRPWLVVGTPGGSTIITTVLQVINNAIDYRMPLPEAVEAPRVHHQWLPDEVYYERGALTAGALDSLRRRGHTLTQRGETSGRVDAIMIDDGERIGWSDLRGYGQAAGY